MIKILLIIVVIIIGLVFLLSLISFIANTWFNYEVTQEVAALFSGYGSDQKKVISQEDLKELPQNVQKWLTYSQIIGKKEIHTVRLKQKVVMRTKPEQSWLPARAVQYFTVDKPSFIWKAKINFAPLVHLVGRDKYTDGKGHMLIKLMSLANVVDAKGPEIDQGALLRYLVETVWFPAAALSDYITWEEIDAKTAKATISYGEVVASGVFTFNDLGEVVSFEAERYMEQNGDYSLEKWFTPMGDYKEFNGIKIPSKGQIIWKLDSGDFNWYNWEIEDIEYNVPESY